MFHFNLPTNKFRIVLVKKIAVNIDVTIPQIKVTAKPRIGPVPKYIRTTQTAAVVILASKIAQKALA
jgi:hypothetical protein